MAREPRTPRTRRESRTPERGTVKRGRAPNKASLLASSAISSADVEDAARTWRRAAPRPFNALLDAQTEDLEPPTPSPGTGDAR